MRSEDKKPIAIACADLHLSLNPPLARMNEPDWFDAMKAPLIALAKLQKELGFVPILIAGDIFNKWFGPAKVINLALEYLSFNIYAVAGQHDLPYHNSELMNDSAFGTLVQAKKINLVNSETFDNNKQEDCNFDLFGFNYGQDIIPLDPKQKKRLSICLAHKYIWTKNYCFKGAPVENNTVNLDLGGYDIAIFGDNHKGFKTKVNGTTVFNCGGFMRRTSDEISYHPQVGIIYSDGTVEPYDLGVKEVFEPVETEIIESKIDLSEFINELSELEGKGLDFRQAMKNIFEREKPDKRIQQIILEAMENG